MPAGLRDGTGLTSRTHFAVSQELGYLSLSLIHQGLAKGNSFNHSPAGDKAAFSEYYGRKTYTDSNNMYFHPFSFIAFVSS